MEKSRFIKEISVKIRKIWKNFAFENKTRKEKKVMKKNAYVKNWGKIGKTTRIRKTKIK